MTVSDNRLRQKLIAQLELSRDQLAEGEDLKADLSLALGILAEVPTQSLAETRDPVSVRAKVDEYEDILDDEDEDESSEEDDYDEYHEPIVPNGFDSAESYDDFLTSQEEHLTVERVDYDTGETQDEALRPVDVAGIVEKDGEYTEVGNFDESLEQSYNSMLENNTIVDDETDEVVVDMGVDEVEGIRVRLTRKDNLELTENDVRDRIIANPQSAMMLRVFGDDFTIVEAETPNKKDLVFALSEEDERARKTGQILVNRPEMMSFAGTIFVPGLGSVSANTVIN